MIEFKRWIDSPDIASWLSAGPPLDLAEQTNCILSAPHRTLEEKLEGLRGLREEAQSLPHLRESKALEALEKRIDMGETLEEIIYHGGGLRNRYEADIFCHGRKEEFLKKRIFTSPMAGIDFIKEQIKEAADRYELAPECFFGVLGKFYRRGTRYFEREWNIILNPEGKILYCLPETAEAAAGSDYWFGPMDYHYMSLPYPSGTVVETISTPFFPSIRGMVVSRVEPGEGEFLRGEEQWLVYPDGFYESRSMGIGVTPLNDYTSITFGGEFVLPFVQFLRRQEGKLPKSEEWLGELGELIRRDKSCLAEILRDRQPGNVQEVYDKRREYVRKLQERCEKKRGGSL